MLAWPLLDGLFDDRVTDGTNCGMSFSSDSMVGDPVSWKSSAPTVTIGLLAT